MSNHASNGIIAPPSLPPFDDDLAGNNPCHCHDPDCKNRNNRHHYRSILSSTIKQSLRNPYNPIPFPPPLLSDLIELIAEYCEDGADINERSVRGEDTTHVAFVNNCFPEKKQNENEVEEKNRKSISHPSPPLFDDTPTTVVGIDSASSKGSAIITPLLQNANNSAVTADASINTTNNNNDNNTIMEEKSIGAASRVPPSPPPPCWDGSVDIYWLNYQGARVRYYHLLSGHQYIQQTFHTHPWLALRSADGQRLLLNGQYLFYPPIANSGKPCVAVITQPPPPNEKKWIKERNGCDTKCCCKCHHHHHHQQ